MRSTKGQSLVEYVLILALVSVVSICMLQALGQSIKNTLDKVNAGLNVTSTSPVQHHIIIVNKY